MKRSLMKITLPMMLLLVGIYACDNEDDGVDILPPTISATAGDPTTVAVGETATITYSVTTPGGYETATVSSNDANVAEAALTTPGTPGDENSTLTVTVTGRSEGTVNITLNVEDEQDQNASDDVEVEVIAGDDGDDGDDGDGGDDLPVLRTVTDTIASIDSLSTLNQALEATGLNEDLGGEGPFTIFAPSNDAFDALLEALALDDLPAVIAELTDEGVADLLRAHVVQDSLPADLLMEQEYPTLNEDQTLTITIDDTSVFVNGAAVLQANISASNGVIHIIDSVVNLPEDVDPGEGEESIDANAGSALGEVDDLSTLNAAVDAADLTTTLDEEEAVTIFAPSNAAFTTLLESLDLEDGDLDGLIEAITAEGVSSTLQAHVVGQTLTSADLADGTELETLNGETITIANDGTTITANGAPVSRADITVNNGVIHIIDEVINTEAAAVGSIISYNEDLSSLAAALTDAELIETLNNGDAEYTVFAPSNEALDAVEGEIDSDVLQGHVVEGRVLSGDLANEQELTALNGETLVYTENENGAFINGIPFTNDLNNTASNGVVHVISGVITSEEDSE